MAKAGLGLTAFIVLLAGMVFGFAGAASADPIGPGFDLLTTLPGAFVCLDPPICTTIVALQGVPLDPANLGDADTIVRRHSGIVTFPDTIPIEIVALHLQSVAPFVFMGSVWHLDVGWLPSGLGSMTVTHESPTGGTFDSLLPVTARFTFTDVVTGFTVVRDDSDLLSGFALWSHEEPLGYPSDPSHPSGGFFPGVIQEQGRFTIHPVRPAIAVPEPSTLFLLASGLTGGLFGRKRLVKQPHAARA